MKRNLGFLKHLDKASEAEKTSIIAKLNVHQLNSICECVLNVLNRNIKLKKPALKKLLKHKAVLRRLAKKRKNFFLKKKLLIQKGAGFLPLLIGPAIALISSLLS